MRSSRPDGYGGPVYWSLAEGDAHEPEQLEQPEQVRRNTPKTTSKPVVAQPAGDLSNNGGNLNNNGPAFDRGAA